MRKVVIIGSPGAGKTTLAKILGSLLKINVFHLDRLFWKCGWEGISGDTRIDILQDIVQEKQWIIEGTYIKSSEPRLLAADNIIFLDISPIICLWRVIMRYHKYRKFRRRDLPSDCSDQLSPYRLWKVLLFPFQEKRLLERRLGQIPPEKVIRIRSGKEMESFLAKFESFTDEKRHPSTLFSKKERYLISTRRP